MARPHLGRRAARLGSRAVLGHPAHPPARRAHLAPRPRALQQVRPQSHLPTPHLLHTFDRATIQCAGHSQRYYATLIGAQCGRFRPEVHELARCHQLHGPRLLASASEAQEHVYALLDMNATLV